MIRIGHGLSIHAAELEGWLRQRFEQSHRDGLVCAMCGRSVAPPAQPSRAVLIAEAKELFDRPVSLCAGCWDPVEHGTSWSHRCRNCRRIFRSEIYSTLLEHRPLDFCCAECELPPDERQRERERFDDAVWATITELWPTYKSRPGTIAATGAARCIACGEPIAGDRRSVSRYCSNACKQFAYRSRKALRTGPAELARRRSRNVP